MSLLSMLPVGTPSGRFEWLTLIVERRGRHWESQYSCDEAECDMPHRLGICECIQEGLTWLFVALKGSGFCLHMEIQTAVYMNNTFVSEQFQGYIWIWGPNQIMCLTIGLV